MYAFPRFVFPEAFIKEAEGIGKPADFLYCLRYVVFVWCVFMIGVCCVFSYWVFVEKLTIMMPSGVLFCHGV